MIFARRVVPSLQALGVDLHLHFVTDRLSPKALWQTRQKIRYELAEFRPRYVHAQYGSVLGFFAWTLGYPLIVTFRGSDVNGDPVLPWWRRSFTRFLSHWTALRAEETICVSHALAQSLLTSSAHVMPSPIDLGLFSPLAKTEARKRLNLDQAKKLVAFAGGKRPLKRRSLALAAVEKAGFELLDIQEIDPLEMPWWINAADALILTSEREGSPNIVREALACGVPVVSVDVGDAKSWVMRDDCSRIAEADVSSLALALQEVLALNPSRVRRVNFDEISLQTYASQLFVLYARGSHDASSRQKD